MLIVGGSDSRLTTSQQYVSASHSGSADTSPTATTTTTSTTIAAAAAVAAGTDACNVTSWSSRDVQTWLHDNDLDSLADRCLCSAVVVCHVIFHSFTTSNRVYFSTCSMHFLTCCCAFSHCLVVKITHSKDGDA